MYGSLFNMWESKLVYEARYTVVDYAHRILEVLRIFFLAFAVVHITPVGLMSDAKSAETFCLCLGFFLAIMVQILLKVELILVGKGDIEAIRNHSKVKIMTLLGPSALLFLAATVISGVLYFKQDDEDIGTGWPWHVDAMATAVSMARFKGLE